MARVKVVNRDSNGDLIGGNFTNTASNTIFSLGTFAVESNFTGKRTREYSNQLSSFNTPITLETLNLTDDESKEVSNFSKKLELNFDKSDLRKFVNFGSSSELFRISVENIIKKYPASLFVSNQVNIGGNITVRNYSFNSIKNKSTFEIPSDFIENSFGLVFDLGNTAKPNDNPLRNLNLSFTNFVIFRNDQPTDNEHSVIGFSGDTSTRPYVIIEVLGNPFEELTENSKTTGNTVYHIKPKNVFFNKFTKNLKQFERYLLSNRLDDRSGFSIQIKEPTLLETGSVFYSDRRLLWSTTDGYNVDISGSKYNSFLNSIKNIGLNYDEIKTDLIGRFLTPRSLKAFDLTENGKITKLLRVYGAEFDQLKTFIDALVTINKVSYDKKSNIPDVLVKNLARTYGWDVFNLVNDQDITQSFFSTEVEQGSEDLLPAEIDIELWRRILINTNYYWKSKGTRDAIKSIFRLIGIPDAFINITEYIYTVEGKIDPSEVELTLDDIPSASFPFNEKGFPIAPIETNDFYFQISGDTDGGQAYINNYRNVGFTLNRIVDNKKSWVEAEREERIHSTTPNYFQKSSKLLVNTKEIDVTLDVARAIEYDVYCYNKEIDDPITSTAVTRPYIYINVELDVNDPLTFALPDTPLSGSSVQMNFNGITLTPTGTTGNGDYYYDEGNNTVVLAPNTITASTVSTGNDVITVTYLHDRLDTSEYTQVRFLVQKPIVLAAGSVLQLPEEPKGDIQLLIDGVTLTKGTSLFTGDFIIDQNDRTKVIIQNNTLKNYLLGNPIIRTWYIVDNNTSNAKKRSEAHRVDSFTATKFFFNSGINRYVYVLDFTAFDVEAIKITLNGITLTNGKDFTLNPSNKRQVYLSSVKLGDVIGAYYIIDDGSITPPLLPPDDTFPDIQDMSFLEYLELINRRLINARRRKVITDNKGGYYPTVKVIYDEYLRRSLLSDNDPIKSNGYTFENLYPFINQYNAFFQRFVNQLLPETIILKKSGILIRNTAFTKQKFTYKRGVNFDPELQWLGTDGSEFLKRIPSVSFEWADDFVCVDVPNPSENFFINNIEVIQTQFTTTQAPPSASMSFVRNDVTPNPDEFEDDSDGSSIKELGVPAGTSLRFDVTGSGNFGDIPYRIIIEYVDSSDNISVGLSEVQEDIGGELEDDLGIYSVNQNDPVTRTVVATTLSSTSTRRVDATFFMLVPDNSDFKFGLFDIKLFADIANNSNYVLQDTLRYRVFVTSDGGGGLTTTQSPNRNIDLSIDDDITGTITWTVETEGVSKQITSPSTDSLSVPQQDAYIFRLYKNDNNGVTEGNTTLIRIFKNNIEEDRVVINSGTLVNLSNAVTLSIGQVSVSDLIEVSIIETTITSP